MINLSTYRPLLFLLLFLALLWLIKGIEFFMETNFVHYGVEPRSWEGLKGILFYPLIHSNWKHLVSNSTALLILGTGLFYFYRDIAMRVFWLNYFITGLWIWTSARASYHIGSSGLIYGIAAFIFTSGIIRRNPKMLVLSLLVTFLYGGMVWGIFPIRPELSWEGHFWGLVAGIILAFYYRNEGPEREKYSWEIEEE